MSEFTARAVILGTFLGVIFGASSVYLVLKVGMTVSASIPVAVISVTLFRLLSKMGGRDATILENNIVQTAGSAGESIAFGIGATMPAIMILGFDLEVSRVILVALLGALLGILMMIPLRRALIVQEHGILKYPEGTACAEVLKASDHGRSQTGTTKIPRPRKAANERTADFRRLRHRFILQNGDGSVQGVEGHAGKNLRAALGQRLRFRPRFRRSFWALGISSGRESLRS